MQAIDALMYVNGAIWFGFAAYCFFMAQKQNALQKRMNAVLMEMENE